ncbi:hypothetical protein AUP68_13657 [Ilyonectria robusta]
MPPQGGVHDDIVDDIRQCCKPEEKNPQFLANMETLQFRSNPGGGGTNLAETLFKSRSRVTRSSHMSSQPRSGLQFPLRSPGWPRIHLVGGTR